MNEAPRSRMARLPRPRWGVRDGLPGACLIPGPCHAEAHKSPTSWPETTRAADAVVPRPGHWSSPRLAVRRRRAVTTSRNQSRDLRTQPSAGPPSFVVRSGTRQVTRRGYPGYRRAPSRPASLVLAPARSLACREGRDARARHQAASEQAGHERGRRRHRMNAAVEVSAPSCGRDESLGLAPSPTM